MVSHLPDNLTANNCQLCNNLLKIELLNAPTGTFIFDNFFIKFNVEKGVSSSYEFIMPIVSTFVLETK